VGVTPTLEDLRYHDFASEQAARKAERQELDTFSDVTLAADGTVCAELDAWLQERELDVQETIANYRDIQATWSGSVSQPLVLLGKKHGDSAFTRTPRPAHWAASSRVSATMAPLLAA
jgi:hypothetical protein